MTYMHGSLYTIILKICECFDNKSDNLNVDFIESPNEFILIFNVRNIQGIKLYEELANKVSFVYAIS